MKRVFSAIFTFDGDGGIGVVIDEGQGPDGQFGYEVGEVEVSGTFTEYLGFFEEEADARTRAGDRLELLAQRLCAELRDWAPLEELYSEEYSDEEDSDYDVAGEDDE